MAEGITTASLGDGAGENPPPTPGTRGMGQVKQEIQFLIWNEQNHPKLSTVSLGVLSSILHFERLRNTPGLQVGCLHMVVTQTSQHSSDIAEHSPVEQSEGIQAPAMGAYLEDKRWPLSITGSGPKTLWGAAWC